MNLSLPKIKIVNPKIILMLLFLIIVSFEFYVGINKLYSNLNVPDLPVKPIEIVRLDLNDYLYTVEFIKQAKDYKLNYLVPLKNNPFK